MQSNFTKMNDVNKANFTGLEKHAFLIDPIELFQESCCLVLKLALKEHYSSIFKASKVVRLFLTH